MQVREITAKDRERWLDLRRQLWPKYDLTQLSSEVDELFSERGLWGLFIAEIDGEAAGFAECRLRDEAPGCTTSGVGYLEAWYVDPKHRRQGVGRALVARCETWARARGASEMASDTTTEYPLSRPAHAALGFVEVKRRFLYRKDL